MIHDMNLRQNGSVWVEEFGAERSVGLSQEVVEERVQEFVDLVQFEITLV